MKVKSWHISGLAIVGIFLGIFVSGSMGATGLGSIFMLALFPVLIWFGWTLHERSLHRNEQIEERVINKLRSEDVSLRRRKASDDV